MGQDGGGVVPDEGAVVVGVGSDAEPFDDVSALFVLDDAASAGDVPVVVGGVGVGVVQVGVGVVVVGVPGSLLPGPLGGDECGNVAVEVGTPGRTGGDPWLDGG